MRPARANEKAAGIGRARMYIRRDLAWLEGYPKEGFTWGAVPLGDAPEDRTLDRQLISRANRTINLLLRDYATALPRLVGDVGRWAELQRAALDLLKPFVHGNEALPESPVERHPSAPRSIAARVAELRRAHPELQSVVQAFEWAWWVNPRELRRSIDWLHHNAHHLLAMERCPRLDGRRASIRLRQLARQHGERRAQPLLAFLGQAEVWTHPLEVHSKYIDSAIDELRTTNGTLTKADERPPPLEPTLPYRIIDWIDWLAVQDHKTQRRGLELFPLLTASSDVAAWRAWWQRVDDALHDGFEIPPARRSLTQNAARLKRVRKRLTELSATTPPAVPAGVVSSLLHLLPQEAHRRLYQPMRRELAGWPAVRFGTSFRLAFADHWLAVWMGAEPARQTTASRLISRFAAYARRLELDEAALLPWKGVWDRFQTGRHALYGLDDDLVHDLTSSQQLDTFFAALAEARDVKPDEARMLVSLCAALPREAVGASFTALRGTPSVGAHLPVGVLRIAGRIAGREPGLLPPIVGALLDTSDRYDGLEKHLGAVLAVFEAQGLAGTLCAVLATS